jgi:hypothetical protein
VRAASAEMCVSLKMKVHEQQLVCNALGGVEPSHSSVAKGCEVSCTREQKHADLEVHISSHGTIGRRDLGKPSGRSGCATVVPFSAPLHNTSRRA